jgi:Iron-containing alcohol dehydrogenase
VDDAAVASRLVGRDRVLLLEDEHRGLGLVDGQQPRDDKTRIPPPAVQQRIRSLGTRWRRRPPCSGLVVPASKLSLSAVLTGEAGPGYVAAVTDAPAPSAPRPFVGPGRVFFGAGAASHAGEQLRTIGVDEAMLRFALTDLVVEALGAASYNVHVAPPVVGEPAPEIVEAAVEAPGGGRVAAVVSVGGGGWMRPSSSRSRAPATSTCAFGLAQRRRWAPLRGTGP